MTESTEGNIVKIRRVGDYTFAQSGESTKSDSMGMREMQARAFAKRDAKYLLIQAPPACGKSRALMFLALDKVINQGIKKVFIAVPQIAIGSSFADTDLKSGGFFADWKIDPRYNLCNPSGDEQKVQRALEFLKDPDAHYLLCSHATLTYFNDRCKDKSIFNDSLVAVDEFHHVSEDADNRLGTVIHSLMTESTAQIIAMTGSYFRGDSVPVLAPEDEKLFERVVYTYYEQLNGYKYLKSLGIDYAFYEGKWVDAVVKLIDTGKKMIIHIPSVNSRESTGDKINEVGLLMDAIGEVIYRDPDTGIYTMKDKEGRTLKVADLVSDPQMQGVTLAALRKKENLDSLNIIIALNMAKEGFDWPQCEYALTAGYRASLTEVVQIIGRATRDCKGKEHAQFTNLLAMPSAMLEDVTDAVNALLKAITLSLLMEQVLAPNVHFRKRSEAGTDPAPDGKGKRPDPEGGITITIDDDKDISDKAMDILNSESDEIITKLLNESDTVKEAALNGDKDSVKEMVHEAVLNLVKTKHPDLSDGDIDAIVNGVTGEFVIKHMSHDKGGDGETPRPFVVIDDDNNQFLNVNGKFINVDDLDFSLIESVNPFAGAYEFISKTISPELLKRLQEEAAEQREKMTEQKAMELWPYVNQFREQNGREPDLNASSDFERRLAAALAYVREIRRERNAAQKAAGGVQ